MRAGLGAAAAVALAVALALLLLLPGLGRAPFDDPGEGQHAEIAREVRGGDWLLLRLNGVRYFDKPPLLYWLVAASFAWLGPGELAARLPAVAGAALAAAATAMLGARLLGPAGGLTAAAALLSSVLFLVFGRYVRPETLFVAGIQWGFTGLLLGLTGEEPARRRRLWLLAGGLGAGLASLAKDPLGLIGPLAAVAAAFALAGRRGLAGDRFAWVAAAAALVVGLGWYGLASVRSPGFLWYTVVDNHLLNAVGLRHYPDEDVALSTAEFLAVSSLGAFPWIAPAALEVAALARRRAWRQPAEAPWVALALWATAVFAFFAVARFKLPHYALPAYPAVALLAVRWWQGRRGAARGLTAALAVAFALLAAALGLSAAGDGRALSGAVFSATDVYTRKEGAAGQGSPLPAWPALAPLAGGAALALGAGSAGLAVALARRSRALGLGSALAAMLAVMPAATAALGAVASARAVAGLAADLRALLRPGDVLVHEGPIENSGALEFYSGRRPALLDARRSVLGIGATFPEAGETFWGAARLGREWASERRVFLVTPRAPARSLVAGLPPGRVHLLEQRDGRWLYSNAGPEAPAGRALAGPSAPALR